MSKAITFSHPEGWNCLHDMMEKLPRAVSQSRAIVLAIEEKNKRMVVKSNLSLDEFKDDIIAPDLTMNKKAWVGILKTMSIEEIRELDSLIEKRAILVDEEIKKRRYG